MPLHTFASECDRSNLSARLPVLALAVLSLGCYDAPAGPNVTSQVEASAVTGQATRQQNFPSLDMLFQRVDSLVPGFAGFYLDASGNAVVRATRAIPVTEMRKALKAVFGEHPAFAQDFTVKPARYSSSELMRWANLAVTILDPSDLASLDIDESDNVLRIGLKDVVATARVRALLSQALIPVDATSTYVAGRRIPLQTLGSRWRPTFGGILIQYLGQVGSCSLGFNVEVIGDPGRWFLTNAHCTPGFGTTDWVNFYNSFQVQPDFLGYEAYDPPFVPAAQFGPSCPPGGQCRYSDAALVKYVTDSVSLWKVAQTQYVGTGSSDGSVNVIPTGFSVIDYLDQFYVFEGQQLDKVGAMSGWTRGPVINACVTVYNWPSPGKHLPCQYDVYAVARPGDSGSPVILQTNTGHTPPQVQAAGIVFLGACQSTGPCPNPGFTFSQSTYIFADFGPAGYNIRFAP